MNWGNACFLIAVIVVGMFVNGVSFYAAFPQISYAVGECRKDFIQSFSSQGAASQQGPTTTKVFHSGLGSHAPPFLNDVPLPPPQPLPPVQPTESIANDTLNNTVDIVEENKTSSSGRHSGTGGNKALRNVKHRALPEDKEEPQQHDDGSSSERSTDSFTTSTAVAPTTQAASTVDDLSNDENSNQSTTTTIAPLPTNGGDNEDNNNTATATSSPFLSLKGSLNDSQLPPQNDETVPPSTNSNSVNRKTEGLIPDSCHIGTFIANVHRPQRLSFTFHFGDFMWLLWITVIGCLSSWAFERAATVDPGVVPHAFLQSSPKSSTLAIKLTGGLTLCPPCASFKPLRAHHCSRCSRCVLKYDHHCPWIGQCVGFFNYKLYLLFVFYTHILSWTNLLCLSRSVLRIFFPHATCSYIAEIFLPTAACHGTRASWIDVLCFLLNFGAMCLTLYLIVQHWIMARSNVTTIEAVVARWQAKEEPERVQENVYDMGLEKNLEQIFGDGNWEERGHYFPRWVYRLLPTAPYPQQSDEVVYSLQTYRSVLQPTASPSSVPMSSMKSDSTSSLQAGNTSRNYGTVQPSTAGTAAAGPADAAEAVEMMIAGGDGKYLGILFPTTIGKAMRL